MSPLVSVCIPCFGRVDYVRNTLNSIYKDNSDVSLNDYEVVISDNDPCRAVEQLCNEFKFPNLRYYHTDCEGFMNSYYVLTYGVGKFLKLHNSQTLFKKGSLLRLIDEVRRCEGDRTIIFYTNGLLNFNGSQKYEKFEDFMMALGYWSSWSNGFNIWKEDFDNIGRISLNKLFPHTSLFLTQYSAKSYCINNEKWFLVQRVKKRGGHNKFEAFSVEYPSLIEQSYQKGHISKKCMKRIFNGIMMEFFPSLLFNKYIARIEAFEITGFYKNIKVYFPWYAYWLSWLLVLTIPVRMMKRKLNIK